MKRIGVVIVLSALTFHTVGFYLYYCAALYRIKTHWRAELNQLPDHKLTRLVLDIDIYRDALVEENELEINGHMFDVVHADVLLNKVHVYGAYDKEEDNLIAQLHKCFSNSEDLENFYNAVADLLTPDYVAPWQHEISISILPRSLFPSFHRLTLYEVDRSVCSPPPDAALEKIIQS